MICIRSSYPKVIHSSDGVGFELHYHYSTMLVQVRLRRSNNLHSVPTILRLFGLLNRVGLTLQYQYSSMLGQVKAVQSSAFSVLIRVSLKSQYQYSTMLGQVRVGKVKAVQQSTFCPNYPQAIRSTDQGRFEITLLVFHYVRLGQVRLRRSNDLHSVPTILRPFGLLTRVGLKSQYQYCTMLG